MFCAVTPQCLCDRRPGMYRGLPEGQRIPYPSVQHLRLPDFPEFCLCFLNPGSVRRWDTSSASMRWRSVPVWRSFILHTGSGCRGSAGCLQCFPFSAAAQSCAHRLSFQILYLPYSYCIQNKTRIHSPCQSLPRPGSGAHQSLIICRSDRSNNPL